MARPRKSEIITTEISAKYYDILTDGILGSTEHVAESRPDQHMLLKGQVSGADLVAAGCDIEWLLKTGQIAEIGFRPL